VVILSSQPDLMLSIDRNWVVNERFRHLAQRQAPRHYRAWQTQTPLIRRPAPNRWSPRFSALRNREQSYLDRSKCQTCGPALASGPANPFAA